MKLPGREVEHYPVALSVESVALGWLRQRQAPPGAVVVADTEIAARTRRGRAWAADEALRAAVIVSPQLAAEAADLLWAHALLAATEALGDAAPWWPDTVRRDGSPAGVVHATSRLGPGAVTAAVLSFRLHVPPGRGRDELLAACLAGVDRLLELPPAEVVAAYRAADVLAGERVQVGLLPRGAARGIARSIDAAGAFTVEGAAGRPRRLAVDSIAEVRTAP